jgi:hypothetical protein
MGYKELRRAFLDDPEEAPLARRLAEDPRDEAARAAYRALLEARGDPRAALFEASDRLRAARGAEQWQILGTIERLLVDREIEAWWCTVDPRRARAAPIHNCGLAEEWSAERFSFECPRTWDSLAPTTDPKVRSCDECRRDVHFCDDDDELIANAREGRCVAMAPPVEAWVTRRAGLEGAGSFTGRPRPADYLALYVRRRTGDQS